MIDGDCGDTRRALARSMRNLPYDRFGWVATQLHEHDDARLDADIAQSLAAHPHERFIPLLIGMLPKRDARPAARNALRALGSVALDALCEALMHRGGHAAQRKHLPRTISRFGGMRAAKVLEQALYEETDPAVRFKILRGLGRLRAERPDVDVDRGRMVEVIRSSLEEAVTVLAWRLGVGQVIAHQERAMTPAAELLTALLEDKEQGAIQQVFRMLHILEPTQEFRIIYDGLRSEDAKTKASSRELLSHVVPEALRKGILAMVDQRSPRKRLAAALGFFDPPGRARLAEALTAAKNAEGNRGALAELGLAYADTLRNMLSDSSDALRSLVSYHIAELGLDELRADIEGAVSTRSVHLAEVSQSALDKFGMASAPELSGAS
jgi:hypothetical protein